MVKKKLGAITFCTNLTIFLFELFHHGIEEMVRQFVLKYLHDLTQN